LIDSLVNRSLAARAELVSDFVVSQACSDHCGRILVLKP
jgi:hypothetical protein